MNTYCLQDYLNEIGLCGYESLHQFWIKLDSKYPPPKVKELERAFRQLEDGDEAAFYAVIFQDYDIALLFAGLRISLYQSVCDWIQTCLADKAPKRILDAGCGNAILTCYLAKLYPDAELVAIDIDQGAILQGHKLAEKLSLTNIKFEVQDIKDFSFDTTDGFDLILSVAALEITSPFLIKQLHNLSKHLKDDALMLNFEKLSNPQIQKFFVQALEESALYPDLNRSRWLTYDNSDGDEISLPAFASTKKTNQVTVSKEMVQSFLLPKTNPLTNLDLSFKQEALSELLFAQLNPKVLIHAYKADFHDGSGSYCFELWHAGVFALLYEHTDLGYRNLRVLPLYLKDKFDQLMQEWLEQTAKYAEITKIIQE